MLPSTADTVSASCFAELLAKLDYLEPNEIQQVRAAYQVADAAHTGQFRKSGEPYITHPIAVTAQCAEWKLDTPALMAALLHDTMEDCGISKSDLAEQFGAQVAELVDGLTKLDKMRFSSRQENQAESFRKMLLAMANDVRVILVKLADRLHNMRTMSDMKREAQARIATETLEIYAPLANRLGLNHSYRELEDLSFKYLHPWRHAVMEKALQNAHKRRRPLVDNVQKEIEEAFAAAGLKARITTREKTIFSIYRKMEEKRNSFAQINDIYGFRILVSSNLDCYIALGILHQRYRPMPHRLKDFIAIPKENGYQSLHTTLIGPANIQIEFQVRTEAMHQVAELGVAAHWMYKTRTEQAASNATQGAKPANWLKGLLDIHKETLDSREFFDNVRVDLFPEDVFVFTPKNRIMSLPRGATVIDFAYAIHSAVGDQAIACKVNNEEVPLRTELQSGDIVEVITSPDSRPNPAWLGFVRTARARSRIRSHLKTLSETEALRLGERLFIHAYRAEGMQKLPPRDAAHEPVWEQLLQFAGNKSLEDLYTEVGQGKRIAGLLAKKLATLMTGQGEKRDAILQSQGHFNQDESDFGHIITLDGSETASVKFAPCCHPIPGDEITGYLERGEGLVVHTADCGIGKNLISRDAERFIEVEWAEQMTRPFAVALTVTAHNRIGAIASITSAIAAVRADIAYINTSDDIMYQTSLDLHLILQVNDRVHLADVLRALRRVPATIRAQRVKSAAS